MTETRLIDERSMKWINKRSMCIYIYKITLFWDPLTNCLIMSDLQLASIIGYVFSTPLKLYILRAQNISNNACT